MQGLFLNHFRMVEQNLQTINLTGTAPRNQQLFNFPLDNMSINEQPAKVIGSPGVKVEERPNVFGFFQLLKEDVPRESSLRLIH